MDEIFPSFILTGELLKLGAGLQQALTDGEFAQSQIEVPKETTELAQTGYVSPVMYDGGTVVMVEMGYGSAEAGDTALYAVKQHEDTTLNHPRGGNAKYLEGPVVAGLGTILARAVAASKVMP